MRLFYAQREAELKLKGDGYSSVGSDKKAGLDLVFYLTKEGRLVAARVGPSVGAFQGPAVAQGKAAACRNGSQPGKEPEGTPVTCRTIMVRDPSTLGCDLRA